MDKKRIILTLGTLALFSSSGILLTELGQAETTIYSPLDPRQAVIPTEADPTQPEVKNSAATENQVMTASQEPKNEPSKKTEPKKQSLRFHPQLTKKTRASQRTYLKDDFFAPQMDQMIVMEKGIGGGAGQDHDNQLVATVKLLSGVAIYGRKQKDVRSHVSISGIFS